MVSLKLQLPADMYTHCPSGDAENPPSITPGTSMPPAPVPEVDASSCMEPFSETR